MSEQAPTPRTKYRAEIVIDGNTLEEVLDELQITYLNWWHFLAGRDEVNIIGGRRSLNLVVTDPEQTPERYREQLDAWRSARRAARTGGDA